MLPDSVFGASPSAHCGLFTLKRYSPPVRKSTLADKTWQVSGPNHFRISSGVVHAAKTRSRGALIKRVTLNVAIFSGATGRLITFLSFVSVFRFFPDTVQERPTILPRIDDRFPSTAAPLSSGWLQARSDALGHAVVF